MGVLIIREGKQGTKYFPHDMFTTNKQINEIIKMINIPASLMRGDTIAITAPASGVPVALHPQLDTAIDYLRSRGYRVVEGFCLREEQKNQSATKHERVAELERFLLDEEIRAVMPPWGGERASDLLDLMRFDILRGRPAKWFSGYSDISTLQIPLLTISGWASIHGPCLMDFGKGNIDKVTEGLWNILEGSRNGIFIQHSSDFHHDEHTNTFELKGNASQFNVPTKWKLLNYNLEHIAFSGRLIGGCLDTLSFLIGTAYGDMAKFCIEHKEGGVILFFENAELTPCQILRALLCMKRNGWFEHLSGIIIGRNSAHESNFNSQLSYIEVLKEIFGGIDFPVIYDADIGHKPPQISLVNGGYCEVVFDSAKAVITQTLK